MTSAQEFLTEFTKTIVRNVDTRPETIAQWVPKLEAREQEIRNQESSTPIRYICGYCGVPAEDFKQLENHQSLRHRDELLNLAKKAAGIE